VTGAAALVSTPAEPSVSVIIPTFNGVDVVRRTLRHLRELDYPDDAYEIIVVDNSADDTPTMVRELSVEPGARIRLIDDSPPLPAIKRNVGVRAAAGDLVWFINDDMWFESSALREHVATHLSADEPIAVLGYCEQSKQMSFTPFVDFYEPFAYHLISTAADESVPYQFFWSMNLTMPRATMLERHLVFHEDWRHIGHEDVELGHRWTQAGYRAVYNPRARGEHFHPHTVASAARLQESIGRGLRDLESLIPDGQLLERYGVLHRRASIRAQVRGVLRELLINRVTAPRLVTWLDDRPSRSVIADRLYWKVLMRYVNVGYRSETPRAIASTETLPRVGTAS
jgi:glycosyltransferase involved in cell wall biosynthesis